LVHLLLELGPFCFQLLLVAAQPLLLDPLTVLLGQSAQFALSCGLSLDHAQLWHRMGDAQNAYDTIVTFTVLTVQFDEQTMAFHKIFRLTYLTWRILHP